GKSESLSGYADLFTVVGKKHKVYSKKSSEVRPGFPVATVPRVSEQEAGATRKAVPAPFDVQKEADRLLVNQYAPPGLIADEHLHILHFRGNAAPFLSPAPGEASLNLLRMVRPEFAVQLRAAIRSAEKQQSPVRKEGILVKRDSHVNSVAIEVAPIKGPE